ncbi:flagellar protein FlaG [Paenibacillus gansuensis]|uniref:Flagellar protein FlaG n=1 Tax=Paenibacillus gansuensis TaxID=306542 RepID=A0ABW5PM70_9BACL
MSNHVSLGGWTTPQINIMNSIVSDGSHKTPNLPEIHNERELKVAELQGRSVTIGEEKFIEAVDRAMKVLQGPYVKAEYSIHEKTKDIMVKIVNRDTGEVIRELPPEKTLDRLVYLLEAAGVIVDEKL